MPSVPRNQFKDCYSPFGVDKSTYLSVTLLDLAIIMFNLHRAATISEIGFQDCDRTLAKLTDELLPRRVSIPFSVIESAVWSSNMLNEIKKFWTPIKGPDGRDEDFDKFMIRVLRYATKEQCLVFDKDYNRIQRQPKPRKKSK